MKKLFKMFSLSTVLFTMSALVMAMWTQTPIKPILSFGNAGLDATFTLGVIGFIHSVFFTVWVFVILFGALLVEMVSNRGIFTIMIVSGLLGIYIIDPYILEVMGNPLPAFTYWEWLPITVLASLYLARIDIKIKRK